MIIGCAMPEAEQGMNVARIASLRAGLPIESSAMTINRYCASGLQSIALAAERIRGGGADVIVAGGTESMSMIPWAATRSPSIPGWSSTTPDSYLSMGLTAERVAQHYGITREQATSSRSPATRRRSRRRPPASSTRRSCLSRSPSRRPTPSPSPEDGNRISRSTRVRAPTRPSKRWPS